MVFVSNVRTVVRIPCGAQRGSRLKAAHDIAVAAPITTVVSTTPAPRTPSNAERTANAIRMRESLRGPAPSGHRGVNVYRPRKY